MTAQQLYDTIKQAYPHSEVSSICCTNQSCRRYGFCADKQSGDVIDFDAVKDAMCKGQTAKPASVDAVCVSGTDHAFYFVELKGWQRYIDNICKQKLTPEETASGYNLSGKLSSSQRLCMQIAADDDLFSKIPVRFLLVTDIDISTNGIEAFHSLLNQLGQSSTDIYLECLSQARKSLESEVYIDRDYVCCKDFTHFLSNQ